MTKRTLICIGCPLGCPLTVTIDGEEVTVSGNTCSRGAEYGKKEVQNPTRIVTSTVSVRGGGIPMVSVKTKEDIPKDKIFECMRQLSQVCLEAPVGIGDVILKDCAGTGIPVVATKSVERSCPDGGEK